MDDKLNKKRLEEDLVHAIHQFQKYAEMSPIERNNVVVDMLERLLKESKLAQLFDCALLPDQEIEITKFKIGDKVAFKGMGEFLGYVAGIDKRLLTLPNQPIIEVKLDGVQYKLPNGTIFTNSLPEPCNLSVLESQLELFEE